MAAESREQDGITLKHMRAFDRKTSIVVCETTVVLLHGRVDARGAADVSRLGIHRRRRFGRLCAPSPPR